MAKVPCCPIAGVKVSLSTILQARADPLFSDGSLWLYQCIVCLVSAILGKMPLLSLPEYPDSCL